MADPGFARGDDGKHQVYNRGLGQSHQRSQGAVGIKVTNDVAQVNDLNDSSSPCIQGRLLLAAMTTSHLLLVDRGGRGALHTVCKCLDPPVTNECMKSLKIKPVVYTKLQVILKIHFCDILKRVKIWRVQNTKYKPWNRQCEICEKSNAFLELTLRWQLY